MSNSITHDPRIKSQIKEALTDFVYGPSLKHLQKRLNSIILANAAALHCKADSFYYKGSLYTSDGSEFAAKRYKLQAHLHGLMDAYLGELHEIQNQEMPYVMGFIMHMLNLSNNLPDYLHILPESVHRPIKTLINTCPCRGHQLTPEQIEEIRQRHQQSIGLMKARMVQNLLL